MNFKIIITLIVLTLSSSIALAIPMQPHVFYGYVTLNGQAAPDGTTVVAKISGVQVASTTTIGGKYGYPIGSFYVSDPNNDRSGETISFFVNNVDTGNTSSFCNACFNLCGMYPANCTSLDLSATVSTSNPSPSPSTGGGGGGGALIGGTSGGTTNGTQNQTVVTQQNQTCHEKWVCGDWGACQNGVQTRTCNDESKCGTNNNEPFTSQPCSKEEIAKTEQTPLALPTGFFLSLSAMEWVTGIIIGVAAALIIIFLIVRNKHGKPTKLMEIKPLIENKTTNETKPTGTTG